MEHEELVDHPRREIKTLPRQDIHLTRCNALRPVFHWSARILVYSDCVAPIRVVEVNADPARGPP